MTDRPCVHVFAECDGPCESFIYRATEITAKAKRELDRDRITNFIGMVFVALLLELGLLIGGVSIWQAGAAQWKSTIIANQEQ